MRVAKKTCEFALMKPCFTIVGMTFLFVFDNQSAWGGAIII